jgi:hypothetical protein
MMIGGRIPLFPNPADSKSNLTLTPTKSEGELSI